MRYMMDTNIYIYAIKNKSESVVRKILSQNPEDLCISVVVYVELMHGVEKSQAVEKNRIAISLSLSTITVLDFDGKAAETYGQIKAELERKGTPIDPMDLLITGRTESQGLIFMTSGTRELTRVTGLRIEDRT